MPKVAGPAAALIDWGYAVKLPLCENWDKALGVRETNPLSLTGFLKACYVLRRPGFVLIDAYANWLK